MMSDECCNIAIRLRENGARLGDKKAVLFPAKKDRGGKVIYTQLTFAELERESDAIARGLQRIGIHRGMRTLIAIKPGLDFFTVMFALFKLGAVPVLIDPGMGRERLLDCVRGVEPEALIGIPLAHMARKLQPAYFASVKHAVTVGRRWLWGGCTLDQVRDRANDPFAIAATAVDELAAILFTSGSTGPAKGVEYEHGMFLAQCRIMERTYGMGADDIDLPTFPPFALFSVALGMTAVIPDMDPTCPARVDPRAVIDPIREHGCTFSFGSPALWARVTEYCIQHNIKLPSLRKVLMAGAPVLPEVHERFTRILAPNAMTHTPYGATESLPTSDMTGREVLAETAELTCRGKGFCVGRPVHGVEVRIIRISDEPIEKWTPDLELPPGEIGEIVTCGPNITRRYFRSDPANHRAKIPDGETIRHRMGDLGYFDAQGRLWFCGRKAHRVRTQAGVMYSVCVEAIFNQHPAVRRSALVGVGEPPGQRPVIVIEPVRIPPNQDEADSLSQELLALAAGNELTRGIQDLLFHPGFPVDVRHNAKINREELARLAAEKLRS